MEELIVVVICLTLNALLASAEMAFVTVGRPRLRELARSGNRTATRILALRDNPERTLSVIQVGITLVGAIAAAVGGAGAEEFLDPILQQRFGWSENTSEFIGIMLVVLPLTYVSVVFGELVPKALALRNPLRIVLISARWLILFDRLLSPVVTALEWSTKKVMGVFFKRSKAEAPPPVPDTVELDSLSQQARQYVLNLVSIEKKKVEDVMLPWSQVVAVSIDQSIEEVESVTLSSGHTRLPVKRDGVVAGLINTKELLALRKSGAESWHSVIRSPVPVQETDSLLRTLRLMQERRSHLGIVYSGAALSGIVTMEDILEEVVGDIYDEDDDGALRRILGTGSTFRAGGATR
jgi:putative hemolysin